MDILYGNSNYHMSDSGMSNTDAWYAGYHQSERSEDLFDYQTSKGYDSQTSDAASDMEPSWDGQLITKQLVNGDAGAGLGSVLRLRLGRRLPAEREQRRPLQQRLARERRRLRVVPRARACPSRRSTTAPSRTSGPSCGSGGTATGDYFFAGVTASTGVGLTPAAAWNTLNSLNSGLVDSEIACFGC